MKGIEVLDVKQINRMGPSGQEETYFRLWVRTDRGASGTLDVPLAEYTEKELQAKLKEKKDQLDLPYNLKE